MALRESVSRSWLRPVWLVVVAVCLLSFGSPLCEVSGQTVSITVYSDASCSAQSGTATATVPANGVCTSKLKVYCGNGQYLIYSYYDTACTQLGSIVYQSVGSCVHAPGSSAGNIFTCPSNAAVPPITCQISRSFASIRSVCHRSACSLTHVTWSALFYMFLLVQSLPQAMAPGHTPAHAMTSCVHPIAV